MTDATPTRSTTAKATSTKTNWLARPSIPKPWPADFQPSGALYGDLPLTVPRPREDSMKIIIVGRDDGVTTYEAHASGHTQPIRFKIDTCNEHILLGGLFVFEIGGGPRMLAGSMAIARTVALKNPPTDPARTHVDHADRDATNDCAANLHWVTPAFNSFNVDRPVGSSGYFGVAPSGSLFKVSHCGKSHGTYRNAEVAALVYNLVCRLHYGDQLNKVPDRLNTVKDEAKRVRKVEERPDGVQIYSIDAVLLVFYDGYVESAFATHGAASKVADTLVARLEDAKRRDAERWAKERATLKVERRASDNVAYFRLVNKAGKTIDVLFDDEDWRDVRVQGLYLIWTDRIVIRLPDGSGHILSRWLLGASAHGKIVDHISGNIHDHRRSNLRATDASANTQNCHHRVEKRSSSGYIGVEMTEWSPRVVCRVKGQNRHAKKYFKLEDLEKAAEWYDIVSIYQYGPGALLNKPQNLAEYLEALERDETTAEIDSFLAPPPPNKQTSPHAGVHLRIVRKVYKYWVGKLKHRGEIYDLQFATRFLGSEVKAAIRWDLWRLEFHGRHMTVNFERMRPVYLYLLDHSTGKREDVDVAYDCIGGDKFARAEAARHAADDADSSTAASGSSSNPISVDSPSPPPEAGPSSRAADESVCDTDADFTLSNVVPAKRRSP